MRKNFIRIICALLSISFCFTFPFGVYASVAGAELTGEAKLINSDLPRISTDFINKITGDAVQNRSADALVSTEEIDAMLNKLSSLHLDVERLKKEEAQLVVIDNSKRIKGLQSAIIKTETAIKNSGVIKLTPNQIQLLFSEAQTSISRNSTPTCPPDTSNTEYFLSGPYTINTSEGNCTYYYVTALPISSASNMFIEHWIPMRSRTVSDYIDSIVNVYVDRVVGAVVGALPLYISFLPWELLLNPPASHYSTRTDYQISTECSTTVKLVWCLSPTFNDYFLGLILNQVSVRELHDHTYFYQGATYGEPDVHNYTLTPDNYNSVSSITRQYWESSEYMHNEYIDKIKYYYNDVYITAISPKYADGIFSFN